METFLLSGGVLLWSGLIIMGVGALLKKAIIKTIGGAMVHGGLIGGIALGVFTLSVLALLSLFFSRK